MGIANEMRVLVSELALKYALPPVKSVVFPLLIANKFSRDCEFMAIILEDGSAGLSYADIPPEHIGSLLSEKPVDYQQRSVLELADLFGADNPVANMIGMAAVNAVCQHVMRKENLAPEETEDSFGNLDLQKGDTLGMVGFFRPILEDAQQKGAGLVIVEKNAGLIRQYPHLPMTTNPEQLRLCNKILITSVTVLNQSIDDILSYSAQAEYVAVVGPTAGYLPDPLFDRGVDAVGGRYVHDGEALLDRLIRRHPWGSATRKLLFQKKNYVSPLSSRKKKVY